MPTTQPFASDIASLSLSLCASLLGGAVFITSFFEAMGRLMGETSSRSTRWLSSGTGIIERTIYFFAALFGAWELIGGWLVLKSLNKFSDKSPDEFVRGYYPYLMGNGLSLLFGVGGAMLFRLLTARPIL